MITSKLTNDATTGSWEYRLRVYNQLQYVDTTDGSLSWEADDVDNYNIPASANAEGRGYYADVPELTPDGIYIQEIYNSADPVFTAEVYEQKSVCIKGGEIISSLAYHLAINASGQVEASNTDAVITANTSIAAIKAKTDTIGSISITWSSPVGTNGTMEIVQNDDYPSGYGIVCTRTGYTSESLAGGTSKLYILPKGEYNSGGYTADLEITGTVSQDGTTVTATFLLTAAQTNTLLGAEYGSVTHYYQCVGITSGAKRHTLSVGDVKVIRSIASAT